MGKFLVENSAANSSDDKETSILQEEVKMHGTNDFQLDSYYGPELPSNILFPDQLNKYLREQIQNLSLENGSLRRSLEEKDDELNNVKRKLSKATLPIAGRASEIAANKIAELSKKLREQNAELEGMKTRAKDAEAKLRQLESNSIDLASTVSMQTSEDECIEKDKQIKTLTEKLAAANAKMCDFRNQCQTLKQDMKLAQSVIEKETGEKIGFQDLAKENGSWRGRAQQIISLQNKIQHLQEQLSNTTVAETPAANVLRQMEKDRRASHEETTKQLNQKTIQLEETRKKLEASRARNKVLENEIVQIKTKLSSLIDKGQRDDQLVASLTNQINVFEDRSKAQVQCFTKMQENINKLQHEIEIEKKKNEQLQKALADRENRIQRLQDQVGELRKVKEFNADESELPTPNYACDDNSSPGRGPFDMKALTIVDSERMRLLELLAVVNRRLDESRRQHTETESQLKKEKFKNAKLETKVARLELERVGVLKTGRGSYSQIGLKSGDPPLDDADIMARQHIEYLEEECLALKTRIETLQMEKEDDLKVFAAMTDTRNMYDKKMTISSITRKQNSPREKGSPCRHPNRKTKRSQSQLRRQPSAGYSVAVKSSFSSEESTQ